MSTKSKGKILEAVTEILEKSISNESTIISKNKKIRDLDGIVREIDIYVETTVNRRKFNIAIECKNYKDSIKIDIDKIGAFYDKCSRLPAINKMIFLTTSNYQKGAIQKAKSRNIELYRIQQEELVDENMLDIESVSIVEKYCKLKSLRFNSNSLSIDQISNTVAFDLYDKKKTLISANDFEKKMIDLHDIWDFMNTNSGILLNVKKTIYPYLKTENLFTKFNNKFYLIDSIQPILEIQYELKPLRKFNKLKKYYSITDNTTLATFSDIDFILNGIKHRLCYVKTADNEDSKLFVTSDSAKKSTELKTFGSLIESPLKKSDASSIKNIRVKTLEHTVADKAIKNVLRNTKNEGSKFLKNESSQKSSSTFIAVDINQKKLFFMIPFSHNKTLISAKFPEPVSLYFNHSVELFHKSIEYKDLMIFESEKDHEALLLQDGMYHKFLQYTVSSILMLHSCVELFVNSCIEDNFSITVKGKKMKKKEIESSLELPEKMELVLPKISNFDIKNHQQIITILIDLHLLNTQLQNLKTSTSVKKPFLETFEKLINSEIDQYFSTVRTFFKLVKGDFFLEEE